MKKLKRGRPKMEKELRRVRISTSVAPETLKTLRAFGSYVGQAIDVVAAAAIAANSVNTVSTDVNKS